MDIAIGPGLGLGRRKITLVRLGEVDQTVVVVVVVLDVVGRRDLTQDDARIAHRGGRLAIERGRSGEKVIARRGDAPRVIPGLGVAVDGNFHAVAHTVVVEVLEGLGSIALKIVVEVEERLTRVEKVIVVKVGVGLSRIPHAIAIGIGEGFAGVPETVFIGVDERLGGIPLAVVVGVGGRFLVIPAAVAIEIGVRFFEERDGRAADEDEVIDRSAALDPNGVVEAVRAGTIGQDNFGLASIGA